MGEKQVEIIVRKSASLIRLEHFYGDQNIVINGNDPFINIAPEWLGQDLHRLVSMSTAEATVYFLPTMVVKKNNRDFEGQSYALKLGDELDIAIGAYHINIRQCELKTTMMTPPTKEGDWRFGQILGGVAIVQLMMMLLCADAHAAPAQGFALGVEAGPMMVLSTNGFIEPYMAFNGSLKMSPWLDATATIGQAFAGKSLSEYAALFGSFGAKAYYGIVDWLLVSFALSLGAGGFGPVQGYGAPHEAGLVARASVGMRYRTSFSGVTLAGDLAVLGLYGVSSQRFDTALSLTPQLEYDF